jgi:hypothetical protein
LPDRATIRATLEHWTKDPDLAGVRGEAIDSLPEEERDGWRTLWADVDALLARAAEPVEPAAGGGEADAVPGP